MVAIGHDPESGFTFCLLHDNFHADSTCFILGFGDRKGVLHLGLVLLDAFLKTTNKLTISSSMSMTIWLPLYVPSFAFHGRDAGLVDHTCRKCFHECKHSSRHIGTLPSFAMGKAGIQLDPLSVRPLLQD